MPAARRSGISTPCAPKPAALRTTAPRLRGSVTESRATMSGGSPMLGGPVEQVVGVGVLVRRHPGGEALVHGAAGHPVQLAAAHLEQGVPCSAASRNASRSRPSRSAPSATYTAVIGHAGAQRLDDGVAPGDPLGVGRPWSRALGPRGAAALVARLALLVDLVVGAVLGLGRRALALEAALDAAPGAGRRALAGLADRALALGVAWPSVLLPPVDAGPASGPVGGVLDLDARGLDPVADRRRRAAKSLAARAVGRCSSSPPRGRRPPAQPLLGAAGARPRRVGGVEPEHGEHRPHRRRVTVRRPRAAGRAACCPRARCRG